VFPPGIVMIPAVNTDHVFYSFLLSFHAWVHRGPDFLHAYLTKIMIYSVICLAG
jgi:hypothetical protein